MANILVERNSLSDIADSIRAKNGTQTTYKPSEMAAAINAIPSGGITPTGTKSITANGTYDVTSYASAEVNVPTGSTPVINSLSVNANGTYIAPSGVDGYSPITVNVPASGSGYNINSGDIAALFDQYAQEKDMLIIDLSFDSAQTSNVEIQHTLGRVPTEVILYPMALKDDGSGYQIGYVLDGAFGQDSSKNRTMRIYTSIPNAGINYPSRKDLISLLIMMHPTAYNFTQSAATATSITIRGGTGSDTKLLAGSYRLAIK